MEHIDNSPRSNESIELESFANNFYSNVDFMFTRRQVPSRSGKNDIVNRYCELELTSDELARIEPILAQNFIDMPESMEIDLAGLNPNLYPSAITGGVLISMEHSDADSRYITVYSVGFTDAGPDGIVVQKDIRGIGTMPDTEQVGLLPNPSNMSEIIFENHVIGQDERNMLADIVSELSHS